MPWMVVDPVGAAMEPIRRFLVEFVAEGNRPDSVYCYAHDLLRWWRWLHAVGVAWDRATAAEVRDLVLWFKQATKPRRSPRTASAAIVGTVNPITRKQYLDDQYKPRTVRHSNAVLRSFYEFWIARGEGPPAECAPQPARAISTRGQDPLQPESAPAPAAGDARCTLAGRVRQLEVQPGPRDPRAGGQQRCSGQ